MQYVATISSVGQITIPSKLRTFLGVKPGDRIVIDTANDTATISRKRDIREVLTEADAKRPIETIAAIERNRGKTAAELKAAWAASPEGRARLKEEYGA